MPEKQKPNGSQPPDPGPPAGQPAVDDDGLGGVRYVPPPPPPPPQPDPVPDHVA